MRGHTVAAWAPGCGVGAQVRGRVVAVAWVQGLRGRGAREGCVGMPGASKKKKEPSKNKKEAEQEIKIQ